MALTFKLETGIQLITRLARKTSIENFYPSLFNTGPQRDEVIEIFSEKTMNPLLYEIISEVLLTEKLGGVGIGAIIFNTDGNFDMYHFKEILQEKISTKASGHQLSTSDLSVQDLVEDALKNLLIVDIFDATQFNVTIQNLENILIKYTNVGLLVFHSLTAFYWSEQNFKVTKMDWYLKKVIRMIQKVVKDFYVVILYTRPEYFSSNKVELEKLEPCCPIPTEERINYRIQICYNNEEYSHIILQNYDKVLRIPFFIKNNRLVWIE